MEAEEERGLLAGDSGTDASPGAAPGGREERWEERREDAPREGPAGPLLAAARTLVESNFMLSALELLHEAYEGPVTDDRDATTAFLTTVFSALPAEQLAGARASMSCRRRQLDSCRRRGLPPLEPHPGSHAPLPPLPSLSPPAHDAEAAAAAAARAQAAAELRNASERAERCVRRTKRQDGTAHCLQ